MIKRLKEKVNTLLEVRKENKGFTLVELIVVIVILAILVGVTIGGIYGYVNKSRINTDINNASAIQSACAVIGTNKDVIKNMKASAYLVASKRAVAKVTWGTELKDGKPEVSATTGAGKDIIKPLVDSILTDDYPIPKVANNFTLTVVCDANGNATVTCKAYTSQNDETPLVAEE